MTEPTSAPAAPEPHNPFPSMALASTDETVTVETSAVHQARSLVEGYVNTPATTSAGGYVIAIVGDYGVGKTHLAIELCRTVDRSRANHTHSVFIEAHRETFVDLYQRFVKELDQQDVTDRVRDYYADIVATELERSELTAEVALRLRSGELDPIDVVDRLRLMDSDLLERVRHKLQDVTRKPEFATALTLLLRPGFGRAVWEWLTGTKPDQILADRGIRDPIDTDTDALEAMGVFALLYGHRDHLFVLIVDELDKLLSRSRETAQATVDAFKKMLEVFVRAKALLVLAGLPDYVEVVGANTVERFGQVIRVAPLTTPQAVQYITTKLGHQESPTPLVPFTTDVVRYLVDLTNGVARKVIRFCYQLFSTATAENSIISEAMVRDVARGEYGVANADVVRESVRRVLDSEGLPYQRDHRVGLESRTTPDYWIPVDNTDGGVAIVITESVFDATGANQLAEQAVAIRNAASDAATILVVAGFLPAKVVQTLTTGFNSEPITYNVWTINDDLGALLRGRIKTIEARSARDPLLLISDRLERLSRQQTNSQRYMEELALHIDELGRTPIQIVTAGGGEQVNITTEVAQSYTSLPGKVVRLFDDASDTLSALHWPLDYYRGLLGSTREGNAQLSKRLLEMAGVTDLLRTLVTVFQDAVLGWFLSHSEPYADSAHDELARMCRQYDSACEALPLYGLHEIGSLAPGSTGRLVSTAARTAQAPDLLVNFEGLGSRVRQALLTTTGDTGTASSG